MKRNRWTELAWDIWCCASVVGIWPRFIEPRLVTTSSHQLQMNCPKLKVLQFSDLHLSSLTPDRYLAKLSDRINRLEADLLLFTGDFVCYSSDRHLDRLHRFLNTLESREGNFCSLGNHDYADYISLNRHGEICDRVEKSSSSFKGVEILFSGRSAPSVNYLETLRKVELHQGLTDVLSASPFRLLHNEAVQVKGINIVGLGDLLTGNCDPAEAFAGYDETLPGVVMSHNPDSLELLAEYPGNLILSGHTHGAQVNLPLIRNQFLAQKYPHFRRGWIREMGKEMYINRGVGAVIPFRWFSPPELTFFTIGECDG